MSDGRPVTSGDRLVIEDGRNSLPVNNSLSQSPFSPLSPLPFPPTREAPRVHASARANAMAETTTGENGENGSFASKPLQQGGLPFTGRNISNGEITVPGVGDGGKRKRRTTAPRDPEVSAAMAAVLAQPATPVEPPSTPCYCCGGRKFFARTERLTWVCVRCHPPLEPDAMVWHEVAAEVSHDSEPAT